MSRTRASVQAGICARWGSGTCAFSANHCDDPTSFMSSRQLQIVAGAHGGNCVLRRYTEDIVIGSCGDSFCTSVSAACEEGTTFQAKNNLCDIVQGDNLDRTLFGSCGNRCSWSPADCGENEPWTTAFHAKCTCEQVQVGACLYQGVYYCAVESESCDSIETWVPVQELLGIPNAPDCRLCRDRPAVAPNLGGSLPVNPVTPATPPPVPVLPAAPSNPDQIRDNVNAPLQPPIENSNKGIILGAALGGGIVIVTLVIMFTLALRRIKSQAKTLDSKDEPDHGPPIHDLVVGDKSTVHVEPDLDELSATWPE